VSKEASRGRAGDAVEPLLQEAPLLFGQDAEYRADLLERGLPVPAADMLLGLFAASRQGHFAPADPTLARLLGRPPTPLREVMKVAVAPAGDLSTR
jgi:hypothetical protein